MKKQSEYTFLETLQKRIQIFIRHILWSLSLLLAITLLAGVLLFMTPCYAQEQDAAPYQDGGDFPFPRVKPEHVGMDEAKLEKAKRYALTGGFEKTRGWCKQLYEPGNLSVLAKFFASIEWWKLIPDFAIFATGAGSGETRNAAMRSTDGDCILIYLSSPTTVSVRLDAISPAKTARAMWIDPQTGDRSGAGEYQTTEAPSITIPKSVCEEVIILV